MFRYDGKLFQTLSKMGDLVILSIFWILGCLPVVTICASTSALYCCCIKCVRRDRSKISVEFWKSYKQNLRQGIPCTLILGLLVYLLLIYASFCSTALETFTGTTREIIAFFGFGVYALLLGAFLPTVCPSLSRFSMPFGKFIQFCFFAALKHLLRTFVVGAAMLVLVYLTMGNLILLIVAPGALAFGATFIYEPIFWKYMPREQAEAGDNWYFEGEERRKERKLEQDRHDRLFRSRKKK